MATVYCFGMFGKLMTSIDCDSEEEARACKFAWEKNNVGYAEIEYTEGMEE